MENLQIISYKTLQKGLGLLGISFPFLLWGSNSILGNSIAPMQSLSAYYHSPVRDIFVGVLCIVSFCFASYKGYPKQKHEKGISDSNLANLTSIFALGIAIFPMSYKNINEFNFHNVFDIRIIENPFVGYFHYGAAVLFFICLAYFCIFVFTKSDISPLEQQTPKKTRNNLYQLCGYGILLVLGIAGILMYIDKESIDKLDPLFWLEAIALQFFGVSWLTKGGVFFADTN